MLDIVQHRFSHHRISHTFLSVPYDVVKSMYVLLYYPARILPQGLIPESSPIWDVFSEQPAHCDLSNGSAILQGTYNYAPKKCVKKS